MNKDLRLANGIYTLAEPGEELIDARSRGSKLRYLGKSPEGMAVYPVTIDPNFGFEEIGTYDRSVDDRISGSWFTCPEAGTAISITAYLRKDAGAGYYKAAIYKKSDKSLVGYTERKSCYNPSTIWGWMTFNIVSGGDLDNDDYYLVAWCNSWAGCIKKVTESGKGGYDSEVYNGFPNPWTQTSENNKCSIYCTYMGGNPPVGLENKSANMAAKMMAAGVL